MKVVYTIVTYVLLGLLVLEPAMMAGRAAFGRNNRTWGGGNGCNFVKIFGFKSPCCITHDHAYKEGGWYQARVEADVDLFVCIWRQGVFGKFFAPVMFLFVRIIGPISFQYGTKRDVPYPVPEEPEPTPAQ